MSDSKTNAAEMRRLLEVLTVQHGMSKPEIVRLSNLLGGDLTDNIISSALSHKRRSFSANTARRKLLEKILYIQENPDSYNDAGELLASAEELQVLANLKAEEMDIKSQISAIWEVVQEMKKRLRDRGALV